MAGVPEPTIAICTEPLMKYIIQSLCWEPSICKACIVAYLPPTHTFPCFLHPFLHSALPSFLCILGSFLSGRSRTVERTWELAVACRMQLSSDSRCDRSIVESVSGWSFATQFGWQPSHPSSRHVASSVGNGPIVVVPIPRRCYRPQSVWISAVAYGSQQSSIGGSGPTPH